MENTLTVKNIDPQGICAIYVYADGSELRFYTDELGDAVEISDTGNIIIDMEKIPTINDPITDTERPVDHLEIEDPSPRF